MRRLALATLIGALSTAGLTAPAAGAEQGGVVTINGRIGTLQVGKSTAGQVRAAIGKPTSSSRRPTNAANRRHLVLQYDCGQARSSSFYFDARGRLANFITSCQSWQTKAGTRVGHDYDDATEREGREPVGTCGDGVVIEKAGRAYLFVGFDEEGSPVRSLAVAGRNGVLGC